MNTTAYEWLPHWPTVTLTDEEYYDRVIELNPHLFQLQEEE